MKITTTVGRSNTPLRPPFAWSFTRLKDYETCPRRYNETKVAKNYAEKTGTAMQEGLAVHKALADRIEKQVLLPDHLKQYEPWIGYAFKNGPEPKAEMKMAVTEQFEPCEYFDKKKRVWLRADVDVLNIHGTHAHIIDWKTGKVNPEYTQLWILGTCVMAHFPEVEEITAEFVWLQEDSKTTLECTIEEVGAYWRDGLLGRVARLQKAHETNNFPPKPNGLCRKYCPVDSCEHCGQ